MAGMNELTRKSGVTATDAKNLFTAIIDLCRDGEKIVIKEFGTFQKKHKPARRGRNPKTGKPVEIAAKDVFVFKAAKGVSMEEIVYKTTKPTTGRRR